LKRAFERLELIEGKLSRSVPRGLGGSNPAWLLGRGGSNVALLPDNMIRKGQVEGIGKGDIRGQVRFVEILFKVAA
jgi:hypothetical protein